MNDGKPEKLPSISRPNSRRGGRGAEHSSAPSPSSCVALDRSCAVSPKSNATLDLSYALSPTACAPLDMSSVPSPNSNAALADSYTASPRHTEGWNWGTEHWTRGTSWWLPPAAGSSEGLPTGSSWLQATEERGVGLGGVERTKESPHPWSRLPCRSGPQSRKSQNLCSIPELHGSGRH
jgi:hypothetical protein